MNNPLPARKPAIVFITTDTQGRDMLSTYVGRPCVETPCLDSFAAGAVVFENSFCSASLCTPARSSWYSGLHPSRNGAWCNSVTMRRGLPLLAELMSGAGYRCKHLGKWHLDGTHYDGTAKADGGFDEDTWYDPRAFHAEAYDPNEKYHNRFGAWNKGTEDENFCFGHRVADRAIKLIRSASDHTEPLFLAVEFDEPHGPYISPPPFRGRYRYEDIYRPPTLNASMEGKPRIQQEYSKWMRKRANSDDLPAYYRRYYECNSYVDYEIGRVIEAVRKHMPHDTVIIYTSDHGDHLGAFGLGPKGPTMYDLTCSVPLIVSAPGFAQPRRVAELVSSVDLWPTILDVAGIDTAKFTKQQGYTGHSLRPVLTGESDSVRDSVIIEYHRFGIGHDQDDGFFPIRCIRRNDWKLVLNLFDRDELYDLANDPHEQFNRIDDAGLADVRDDMHDELIAHMQQTSDPFRGPRWMLRPWRKDVSYSFEGLRTTGWHDQWPDGESFELPEQS